jgi:hypothetical protein
LLQNFDTEAAANAYEFAETLKTRIVTRSTNGRRLAMKLATLFTLVMMAGTAFAQDYADDPNYAQDVRLYLSRMQYSSLSDPADAGAADGAYYADLMANNGVRRVSFQLVGAKEILNPRWKRTDERGVGEYDLAFTFAFNDEAAIRGMLSPNGQPYQHGSKPAA